MFSSPDSQRNEKGGSRFLSEFHQKTKYLPHTLTSYETAFVSLSERRLACYIVLGLTALALADNDTTVLLLESRLLQPGKYTCCADLHATRGRNELGWLDKF